MNTSQTTTGICCPLTGFNFFLNREFITGSLVMVIWSNLFSFFWHSKIMGEAYQATASLWRGPQDMDTLALNSGISLMAIIATYIFMKGYEGTGWREGLRFGILISLLFLGMGLITFATQPMPANIIKMWALGDLIMFSVGGIILSAMVKKKC